eukprot:scaffold9158_cov72-Cylindrotheca_fusiformis.AAC.2
MKDVEPPGGRDIEARIVTTPRCRTRESECNQRTGLFSDKTNGGVVESGDSAPIVMDGEPIAPLLKDGGLPHRRKTSNEGDRGPFGWTEGQEPEEAKSAPDGARGEGESFTETSDKETIGTFPGRAKQGSRDARGTRWERERN